jgi:hypothetical protein
MCSERAEVYAHTNGSADPKDWQPLRERLENIIIHEISVRE